MAQENRINEDLRIMGIELDELPEAAEDWPDMTDVHQDSFASDWSNTIGGVQVMETARLSGGLTEAQSARFGLLKARLRELLPTIDRLGLARPNFEV